MRATFTCFLAFFFLIAGPLFSQTTQDAVVNISATVDVSTPKVTLTWSNPSASNIVLFRRDKDADTWYVLLQESASTATNFEDELVDLGYAYEYGIQRFSNNIYSYGYLAVNVETPVVDNRGVISVFTEEALEAPLATELERFRNDLIGDGWKVVWHSVAAGATVADIKSQILDDVSSEGTTTVFLFGELPVPYSGNVAWDGHGDHQGAWPADSYYGDLQSDDWTDFDENTMNNPTQPSRPETVNIPGDGKFDNSIVPSHSELAVGRVDFSNISETTFGTTRLELYRRYLNKNHNWRSKQYTVDNKTLVDDNFGYFNGYAFAANGYRNGNALVGVNNVQAGDFFDDTDDKSFLFAYGCGPGTYTSANGVGNSSQFASDTINAVFVQLFGSYHGDWDYSPNPFMMSALASKGGILSCGWAGYPHWFTHHLGGGETIGYCFLSTQNSCENGGYFGSPGECGAHIALLGDPTVRAQIVAPASNVSASQNCNEVELTWTASSQADVIGYHIYRSSTQNNNYYDRLTGAPVTSTTFTDTDPIIGDNYYLVKAVVREENAGGIFYNTSTGASASLNLVPVNPPVIDLPVLVILNCINSDFHISSCGPGVDCTIQGPGGSMNVPPLTISQPGNYLITATDIASGCTTLATITVELDNVVPGAMASIGSTDCASQTVQLMSSSPSPSVTYQWTGPNGFTSNEQNPVVTLTGQYNLIVTSNNNGCTSTATLTVPPFNNPDASATGGSVTCAAPSVQLMGNSTTGNVSYAWSGPNGFTSNEQNPIVTSTGDYILTVTAANGCFSTATATVTLLGDLPQANPTVQGELSCTVTEVTIQANPDMAGYTFAWVGPNGFTSNDENPLVTLAGTYTVVITNQATGCTNFDAANVSQSNDVPQANPTPLGALTCNVNQVTIMANPDIAGYNFLWSGPNNFTSTDENPVVTEAGIYELVVTSPGTGCAGAYLAFVEEVTPPIIIFDIPDIVLNCTNPTASLDLTQLCTSPGITCFWNGVVVTGPVTDFQGDNLIEVFDNATGCLIGSDHVQVVDDTAVPDLTVMGDLDLLCADDMTTLTAFSNTPGIVYWWEGLDGNPVQTVGPGTYNVMVTAMNNCITEQTVTVTSPPALQITLIATTVDCDGNFSPVVEVTGGVPPYVYDITISPPSPNIFYEIMVIDFNGCTLSSSGTIVTTPPISVTASQSNVTVFGGNDGTATATPSGGTAPYSYLWSNNQTSQTATNLSAGEYSCTVTDVAGCTAVVTVLITEPDETATSELPGLHKLALSPNPTAGQFQLRLELENPLNVRVEILDVTGRILTSALSENILEKTWQFDLSASPSGVYFCKIVADGKVAVLKLAKME